MESPGPVQGIGETRNYGPDGVRKTAFYPYHYQGWSILPTLLSNTEKLQSLTSISPSL